MEAAEVPDKPTLDVVAEVEGVGTFAWVHVAHLHFDQHYQRGLNLRMAEELATHWEDEATDPPVVSRRKDGSLWVVSGQHRVAAHKLLKRDLILVRIVDNKTVASEAHLRVQANKQLSESSLDRFKARLAAREPAVVDIDKICRRFDTKVNTVPTAHAGINSPSSLERIYEIDRGALLARTFQIIQDAWGAVGGKHTNNHTIQGIAWFIGVHDGAFDRERLIDKLEKYGADALYRRALAHGAVLGGSTWVNFYRALIEAYNERLAAPAQLEAKTGGWSKLKGGWGR